MSSTIQVLEPTKLVTHRLRHGGLELSVANFAEDRLLNNYLEHHQVWEPWQLDLMLRVIKPHFTCVDVGANVGINALFASQLCPRGRVLAYEPFAAIFQVLQHNLARNPSQNVEAIPMGLSDASASLQMVAHTSCVGLAHVAPAGQDTGDGATEIARFQRLEDQMREKGVAQIDFIKVDVEGHEVRVLAGGESHFRDPNMQLVVEYSPQVHQNMTPSAGPFADRPLFEKLRSLFPHIFYMTRDSKLLEIQDWHSLRRRLMGGYYVDDLYCAHRIRPEIEDAIITGPPAAREVLTTHETAGAAKMVFFNRDPDGWAMADAHNPPVCSVEVTSDWRRPVLLRFSPIHSKHVPKPRPSSWPVWVSAGQTTVRVDLLDKPQELQFIGSGPRLDITMQSEHQLLANQYLGNPADTRRIGFHVSVEEAS